MNTKTCTACEGSGKIRETTYFTDVTKKSESIVVNCKVCKGLGQVPKGSFMAVPKVELKGIASVVNPGDTGYEEAKQRLLNKQKVG